MSEDIEKYIRYALIAGGLYVGYQFIKTPAISTGIGDVATGTGELLGSAGTLVSDISGAGEFVGGLITTSDTLGEGARCVNNAQCSSSGAPGGMSVGIDTLGQQDYGCCGGRCKKKDVDPFWGFKTCPLVAPNQQTQYPGLNERSLGGECSNTGFTGYINTVRSNPLNIGDCGGFCKIMLKDGKRVPETNLSELSCPAQGTVQTVIEKPNPTYALGARCAINADCSSDGYYGGPPSTGIPGLPACVNSICSTTQAVAVTSTATANPTYVFDPSRRYSVAYA